MLKTLARLFRRTAGPAGAPPAQPRVPDGRLVYAIGDIHGRADLLGDLHAMIADDLARRPGRQGTVVYLGDYIDRGMQSRGVIDTLLDRPVPGARAIHLSGNHEAMLLEFLASGAGGVNWLYNGGNTTVFSYGVRLKAVPVEDADLTETRAELAAALGSRHLDFFRGLGRWHEEGDYLFVHAGVRPGVALAQQNPLDLMWIRDDFLRHEAPFGHTVVHGHTVTSEVDERPNRIGIDTGAYITGRLTCLVLEGGERRYLAT